MLVMSIIDDFVDPTEVNTVQEFDALPTTFRQRVPGLEPTDQMPEPPRAGTLDALIADLRAANAQLMAPRQISDTQAEPSGHLHDHRDDDSTVREPRRHAQGSRMAAPPPPRRQVRASEPLLPSSQLRAPTGRGSQPLVVPPAPCTQDTRASQSHIAPLPHAQSARASQSHIAPLPHAQSARASQSHISPLPHAQSARASQSQIAPLPHAQSARASQSHIAPLPHAQSARASQSQIAPLPHAQHSRASQPQMPQPQSGRAAAHAVPRRAEISRADPTPVAVRPRRAATVRADPSFAIAPSRRAQSTGAQSTVREPSTRAPSRR